MRFASEEIEKIIRDGVLALDSAVIELAALAADAEADRLEKAGDFETGSARAELLAGARAARRIAMSIRALKSGGVS